MGTVEISEGQGRVGEHGDMKEQGNLGGWGGIEGDMEGHGGNIGVWDRGDAKGTRKHEGVETQQRGGTWWGLRGCGEIGGRKKCRGTWGCGDMGTPK